MRECPSPDVDSVDGRLRRVASWSRRAEVLTLGEGPVRVDLTRQATATLTTGIGASCSLPFAPARVP
jgi:hypothetical protein